MASYDVKENPSNGRIHAVMKPESEGIDFKKYNLTSTEIRAVDNGFVVSCRYRIKSEFEKSKNGKELDYDSRYRSEEHVCQSREECAEFVAARILGKDAASSKPKAAPKAKYRTIGEATR